MAFAHVEGSMSLFCCRWVAADGNDQVCGCCDSTCGPDAEFAAYPYGGWLGLLFLRLLFIQAL